MTEPLHHPGARARRQTLNLRALWAKLRGYLRYLNGDTAYAQYLSHYQGVHHGAYHSGHDSGPYDDTSHDLDAPLSRAEFFKLETERRWTGVRRCC